MTFLRTLFGLNHDIILFAYGLVFFAMGLVIALQPVGYSLLELARSPYGLALVFYLRSALAYWRSTRQ